ncbi:MAG TPA: NUDIX domain-containing protein, partial [Alphaproteobacteria bacterium]|nr:NUDIX domain-containing protein [Alphaproteobacteria bacterium]
MTRSYPERPIAGVGALVFRGEEVLLIKRGKPPREGQWSIPGGAQHLGESVAEAARREVREEAGIEIEVKEVIAVVDLLSRDEGGRV